MRVELEIAEEVKTTEFQATDNQLTDKIIGFQRQVELPVRYKCVNLDCAFRIDLIVEGTVIVELKKVSELLPVHSSQLLTYLKLSGKPIGLLINFNVPVIKKGLKRVVNHYIAPMPDAPRRSLSSPPLLRASALNEQPSPK